VDRGIGEGHQGQLLEAATLLPLMLPLDVNGHGDLLLEENQKQSPTFTGVSGCLGDLLGY